MLGRICLPSGKRARTDQVRRSLEVTRNDNSGTRASWSSIRPEGGGSNAVSIASVSSIAIPVGLLRGRGSQKPMLRVRPAGFRSILGHTMGHKTGVSGGYLVIPREMSTGIKLLQRLN